MSLPGNIHCDTEDTTEEHQTLRKKKTVRSVSSLKLFNLCLVRLSKGFPVSLCLVSEVIGLSNSVLDALLTNQSRAVCLVRIKKLSTSSPAFEAFCAFARI